MGSVQACAASALDCPPAGFGGRDWDVGTTMHLVTGYFLAKVEIFGQSLWIVGPGMTDVESRLRWFPQLGSGWAFLLLKGTLYL